MTAAATARALRAVLRSPALLVSPLTQSLFFLLIYSGQLGNVGTGYLDGQAFIAFLLPLILLTGVATGAGAAGTLTSSDITSGYLDRLRVAHGTVTPFLAGTVLATLVAVAVQALLTIGGAMIAGCRPNEWTGTLGMLAVMLILGVSVALCSVAVAVRTSSSSSAGLVTPAFFGLSFFTGVSAPVDELSGWMRVIFAVPPSWTSGPDRGPGCQAEPGGTAKCCGRAGASGAVEGGGQDRAAAGEHPGRADAGQRDGCFRDGHRHCFRDGHRHGDEGRQYHRQSDRRAGASSGTVVTSSGFFRGWSTATIGHHGANATRWH
ncbi:ABC transporter permease [Streptosporangium roseum]|uniref:ABC transporter permease n=1 Tax=Streptosporangium roseum TaxID=2001 RepID=UPI003325C7CE